MEKPANVKTYNKQSTASASPFFTGLAFLRHLFNSATKWVFLPTVCSNTSAAEGDIYNTALAYLWRWVLKQHSKACRLCTGWMTWLSAVPPAQKGNCKKLVWGNRGDNRQDNIWSFSLLEPLQQIQVYWSSWRPTPAPCCITFRLYIRVSMRCLNVEALLLNLLSSSSSGICTRICRCSSGTIRHTLWPVNLYLS